MVHTGNRVKRAARRSGFVYKPRSADTVKKRAERTGGRFDSPFKQGFDTWRPKVGENLIRFLPPTWEDADHYGYTIWVHSYVGPDNSTYNCPQKMGKGKCPICAAAKEAKDAGEAEEGKQLTAKEQVVAWIVDRDAEDPNTPLLYAMSWTMDRDISSLCHNKRTGKVLLIDAPDDGFDVTIKRSGQGLKTRYFGMAVAHDSSPIVDDEKDQEEILEYVVGNPIPSTLHFYDYAYLERILTGTVEERDEELDETEGAEEEEVDGKKKPARRSARRSEPEEEEVEEEEVVVKKKKKTVSKQEELPFEEDEEAVEEEADDEDEAVEEVEEEVDEEDEAEEGDNEEEEEKPRGRPAPRSGRERAGRLSARRAARQEENGEDVEDEEEEEEKPRRPIVRRPSGRPVVREERAAVRRPGRR